MDDVLSRVSIRSRDETTVGSSVTSVEEEMTNFKCPQPECSFNQFGSASGCIVCSVLYPQLKKAEAEIEMLTWENSLDNGPEGEPEK